MCGSTWCTRFVVTNATQISEAIVIFAAGRHWRHPVRPPWVSHFAACHPLSQCHGTGVPVDTECFYMAAEYLDICAAIFPHTSRKSYTENTLPAKQFSDPVLNSCGNSPNVSPEQQLQHTTGPCRTTHSSHRHQPTKVLTKGGDLPRAQVDVLRLFRHSCVLTHRWGQ